MKEKAVTETTRMELLEELRMAIGADFISDIKFSPFYSIALRHLTALPVDRFSLHEWNDAVAYLLIDKRRCANPHEAQQRFKRYLAEKRV